MEDSWEWSCRICSRSGPYFGSDKVYPQGWVFNLTQGLVCKKCAKQYNIKQSDVEKEEKKAYKTENWECL